MVIAIGIAFAFGKAGVIALFGFASFTALREFVTLLSTRRADHLALVIAFFVVLPAQYYLIWIEWYGLYSIFIPVYAFLLLPIIAALRGDTKAFMPRVAEVQWALMICVFCVSHVPALLTLNIPGYEGRQLLLIAFLVLVVQSSDVLQYVWGKLARATQDRAVAVALEDRGGLRRRRREREPGGRRAVVDHAVLGPAGGRDGARRSP